MDGGAGRPSNALGEVDSSVRINLDTRGSVQIWAILAMFWGSQD